MMTNDMAARHTLDANGRLHRPDGTFATREQTEAYRALLVFAVDFCAARELVERRAARAFFAPETRPQRATLPLWKVEARRIQQAALWGFTN